MNEGFRFVNSWEKCAKKVDFLIKATGCVITPGMDCGKRVNSLRNDISYIKIKKFFHYIKLPIHFKLINLNDRSLDSCANFIFGQQPSTHRHSSKFIWGMFHSATTHATTTNVIPHSIIKFTEFKKQTIHTHHLAISKTRFPQNIVHSLPSGRSVNIGYLHKMLLKCSCFID